MPRRRTPRSQTRAEYWVGELAAADGGDQALEIALRWVKSAIANLADTRPAAGEAGSWELARQLAAYAARLPRAKIPHRTGLEDWERQQLLNPWAQPQDGPR